MKRILLSLLVAVLVFTEKGVAQTFSSNLGVGCISFAGRNYANIFDLGDTAIYIIGGNNGTLLGEVYKLNLNTDCWTQLPNYPGPAGGVGSFVLNGTAYTIGTAGDTWRFNPYTNQFYAVSGVSTCPAPGGKSVYFAVGDTGYCLAGINTNNTIFRMYQFVANQGWLPNPIPGSDAPSWFTGVGNSPVGFTIQNKLYAGMGTDAANNEVVTFGMYNPATNTWSQMDSYPATGHYQSRGFGLNCVGFVGTGGRNAADITSELWKFDPCKPNNQQWAATPIHVPGTARMAASACSWGNSGYIGFGFFGDPGSGTYFNDLYKLTPNAADLVCPTCPVVGINDLSMESYKSVYPNPATNQLTVDLGGLQAEQVSIYNVDGKLVSEMKQPAYNSIDISTLAAGFYVAEIKVREAVQRVRWVKM
jgi:hypothetical protein